jgi:DNA-binding CsgD family transcriptional regulator
MAITMTNNLNPREIAVLRESAFGLVAKEIGLRLGMTRRTVDFYRCTALKKLGTGTTAGAVAILIRKKII